MEAKNKKIVIVEDDQFILKALEVKLKYKDVNIKVATDGAAGLELVRKEMPDLVLLDLILPEMHGFDVLKELKANEVTKNIPVIILTNLGQEEEEKKGRDLGALDYYVKASTSLEDILGRIEEVLA